jgi:hypothetical protein
VFGVTDASTEVDFGCHTRIDEVQVEPPQLLQTVDALIASAIDLYALERL